MNKIMQHKVEVLCDWLLRVEHEGIMQYFVLSANDKGMCVCVCVRACDCVCVCLYLCSNAILCTVVLTHEEQWCVCVCVCV